MEFSCPVVRIDKVERHPNADSLILCNILGYVSIASDLPDGSQRYHAGDYVIYIPESAIVPKWMLKKMGFWNSVDYQEGKGTLSGAWGDRVKTIRLRKEISQGLMYPVKSVNDDEFNVEIENDEFKSVKLDEDVSEILGIRKYEPSIPKQMRGMIGNLFGYTKSFDVDSLQKNLNVFSDGEMVSVFEKIHGSQISVGFLQNPPEGEKSSHLIEISGTKCAYVTSKGRAKQGLVQRNNNENQNNVYVKAYNKHFKETGAADIIFHEYIGKLGLSLFEDFDYTPISDFKLIVYGEVFGPGIQSGYTYNQKEQNLRIFDVYLEWKENVNEESLSKYLNDSELDIFCKKTGLKRVPVLWRGPYSYDKMIEFRDGKTIMGDGIHIREGIVIQTQEEKYYKGLPDNRKQVKFVSPNYLLKTNGSEIG